MDIRNLLNLATQWRGRKQRAHHIYATRSIHPSAVRVRRTTAPDGTRSPRRLSLLPVLPALAAGLGLVGLVGLVVMFPPSGWFKQGEWSVVSGGDSQKSPGHEGTGHSCLLPEEDSFTLTQIPAGTYPLPTPTSGLYPFTRLHRLETIVIDTPFQIQEHPVSRALFKRYADSIAGSPDGEEKERRLAHLGHFWNRETAVPVVKGVSLEAAMDFGRWLSQRTGCTYEVPSREEWLATLVHHFNSGAPLPKPGDAFDATPLKSLLQGGNEWTRSPCALGYYLVGEEDWGVESKAKGPVCMPGMFAVAGFRLVARPESAHAGRVNASEKTNH